MITKDFSNVNDLICVILFGSTAREEDGDEYSDVDIFMLVENVTQERIEEIIEEIQNKLDYNNIGISLYRKDIYNQLLLEGSMFLWHLKLEGKVLYTKKNVVLFDDLLPFTKFNENMLTYENLYLKTKQSFEINGINIFDLSQLFFICRNICLLTCFKLGHPTFGRMTVYSKLIECINFSPLDWENYEYLANWRLCYLRGIEINNKYPNKEELLEIITQIDRLMDVCREIIMQEE